MKEGVKYGKVYCICLVVLITSCVRSKSISNELQDVYFFIEGGITPINCKFKDKLVDANTGMKLVNGDCKVANIEVQFIREENENKLVYLFIYDSNFVSSEKLQIGNKIDANIYNIERIQGTYNYVKLERNLLGVIDTSSMIISYFTWNTFVD